MRPARFPTNALVFQGRSVFPWMTVEDNITYGLKLTGVPRSERRERATALLRLIGIERFRASFPHQLSEGMRQRVAIARALAVDPDLLLMDEPFSALDEQTKLILQDEVLDIWERTRKTIVFITHSIDEALVMADRIVVFTAQPGRVKAIVDVDFPRPRDFLTVRSDPHFAAAIPVMFGSCCATRSRSPAAGRWNDHSDAQTLGAATLLAGAAGRTRDLGVPEPDPDHRSPILAARRHR